MSFSSAIGFVLLTICFCVGTIVVSINADLGQALIDRLDISDAFYGILFLLLIFSFPAFNRH